MARFPLRLRLALAKARLLHRRSAIRYLRPDEILHPKSQHPVSHEAVHELIRDHHSLVWIADSQGDPLAHPGIGHLTRLLAQRHFTFLETNAITLRQRIHEFQPLSRLYLVVRFLGSEAEHDRRMGRPGAFQAAIEGIRAAQLSGFLICAKMESTSAGLPETGQLRKQLHVLGLDGIMSAQPNDGSDSGWSRFLRLAEQARSSGMAAVPRQQAHAQSGATNEEGCEEVAPVQ